MRLYQHIRIDGWRPLSRRNQLGDIFDRMPVLSDLTRARLLRLLSSRELAVGELASIVQMPQSTVSRHLKVLRTDGWVLSRKEGTTSMFSLTDVLPAGGDLLLPAVLMAAENRWARDDDHRLAAILEQRTGGPASFFGKNAERWEELRAEMFGTAYALPAIAALAPSTWRVLDLGTGTGSTLAELAPSVQEVIGVDRERAMLDAAALRCDEFENVQLVHAGLDELPLPDNHVDAALALLVLHHVDSVLDTLAEAHRVLKPGGRIVILDMIAHDRGEYRQSMGHVHLGFDKPRLIESLSQTGFRQVRWRTLPADMTAKGPALFLVDAIAGVSVD